MWFCHTRPEDVDLFYLPYGLRQDRIARWLTGTVTGGHRGAKNRDAWRDRRIRLVYRAPEPGRQREDLDRSPFATSALTSLRKERLNMCRPVKLAIPGDTRLPAITTGKRTVRSP